MGIFSRIGLIPTPPVKRPRDLAYASMERPPMGTLAVLAAQHAATALALIAYVLAAAHIGGLDTESTRDLISAAIIGMALSTALQSIGGRFGSGTMLVHIPDPLLVAISGLVCAEYGLGGMVLGCLVNGVVGVAASFVMPKLRTLLPPTVAGVVVCVGGLSLVEPAVDHTFGLHTGEARPGDALLGTVTLAVIVVLSIWGSRTVKLFALLAGIVAGVVLAAAMGMLPSGAALATTPVLGAPSLAPLNLDIPIGVLLAVAMLALMVQLDTFASVIIMQKMNDDDWRRADMNMVGGGIRASALATLLVAPLGGYPNAVSSANLALCHISRSTSRWIGLAVAALLLLLSFMPQLSLALTLVPTAIIGAVELYAAAYLIVSGIELIASRAMDSRGIFMVGLAFVAGMGVMVMPDIGDMAPEALSFMARNGIVVAGLTAILLNLAFRVGSSQRTKAPLHDVASDQELANRVIEFVETSGAAWGARHDAIRRAAQAALEAIELLHGGSEKRRALEIRGRFDEFNLDIEIMHEGPPVDLQPQGRPPANLLDTDDDAFEAALEKTMSQVSHTLMLRLADRVHAGKRPDGGILRLHFDH